MKNKFIFTITIAGILLLFSYGANGLEQKEGHEKSSEAIVSDNIISLDFSVDNQFFLDVSEISSKKLEEIFKISDGKIKIKQVEDLPNSIYLEGIKNAGDFSLTFMDGNMDYMVVLHYSNDALEGEKFSLEAVDQEIAEINDQGNGQLSLSVQSRSSRGLAHPIALSKADCESGEVTEEIVLGEPFLYKNEEPLSHGRESCFQFKLVTRVKSSAKLGFRVFQAENVLQGSSSNLLYVLSPNGTEKKMREEGYYQKFYASNGILSLNNNNNTTLVKLQYKNRSQNEFEDILSRTVKFDFTSINGKVPAPISVAVNLDNKIQPIAFIPSSLEQKFSQADSGAYETDSSVSIEFNQNKASVKSGKNWLTNGLEPNGNEYQLKIPSLDVDLTGEYLVSFAGNVKERIDENNGGEASSKSKQKTLFKFSGLQYKLKTEGNMSEDGQIHHTFTLTNSNNDLFYAHSSDKVNDNLLPVYSKKDLYIKFPPEETRCSMENTKGTIPEITFSGGYGTWIKSSWENREECIVHFALYNSVGNSVMLDSKGMTLKYLHRYKPEKTIKYENRYYRLFTDGVNSFRISDLYYNKILTYIDLGQQVHDFSSFDEASNITSIDNQEFYILFADENGNLLQKGTGVADEYFFNKFLFSKDGNNNFLEKDVEGYNFETGEKCLKTSWTQTHIRYTWIDQLKDCNCSALKVSFYHANDKNGKPITPVVKRGIFKDTTGLSWLYQEGGWNFSYLPNECFPGITEAKDIPDLNFSSKLKFSGKKGGDYRLNIARDGGNIITVPIPFNVEETVINIVLPLQNIDDGELLKGNIELSLTDAAGNSISGEYSSIDNGYVFKEVRIVQNETKNWKFNEDLFLNFALDTDSNYTFLDSETMEQVEGISISEYTFSDSDVQTYIRQRKELSDDAKNLLAMKVHEPLVVARKNSNYFYAPIKLAESEHAPCIQFGQDVNEQHTVYEDFVIVQANGGGYALRVPNPEKASKSPFRVKKEDTVVATNSIEMSLFVKPGGSCAKYAPHVLKDGKWEEGRIIEFLNSKSEQEAWQKLYKKYYEQTNYNLAIPKSGGAPATLSVVKDSVFQKLNPFLKSDENNYVSLYPNSLGLAEIQLRDYYTGSPVGFSKTDNLIAVKSADFVEEKETGNNVEPVYQKMEEFAANSEKPYYAIHLQNIKGKNSKDSFTSGKVIVSLSGVVADRNLLEGGRSSVINVSDQSENGRFQATTNILSKEMQMRFSGGKAAKIDLYLQPKLRAQSFRFTVVRRYPSGSYYKLNEKLDGVEPGNTVVQTEGLCKSMEEAELTLYALTDSFTLDSHKKILDTHGVGWSPNYYKNRPPANEEVSEYLMGYKRVLKDELPFQLYRWKYLYSHPTKKDLYVEEEPPNMSTIEEESDPDDEKNSSNLDDEEEVLPVVKDKLSTYTLAYPVIYKGKYCLKNKDELQAYSTKINYAETTGECYSTNKKGAVFYPNLTFSIKGDTIRSSYFYDKSGRKEYYSNEKNIRKWLYAYSYEITDLGIDKSAFPGKCKLEVVKDKNELDSIKKPEIILDNEKQKKDLLSVDDFETMVPYPLKTSEKDNYKVYLKFPNSDIRWRITKENNDIEDGFTFSEGEGNGDFAIGFERLKRDDINELEIVVEWKRMPKKLKDKRKNSGEKDPEALVFKIHKAEDGIWKFYDEEGEKEAFDKIILSDSGGRTPPSGREVSANVRPPIIWQVSENSGISKDMEEMGWEWQGGNCGNGVEAMAIAHFLQQTGLSVKDVKDQLNINEEGQFKGTLLVGWNNTTDITITELAGMEESEDEKNNWTALTNGFNGMATGKVYDVPHEVRQLKMKYRRKWLNEHFDEGGGPVGTAFDWADGNGDPDRRTSNDKDTHVVLAYDNHEVAGYKGIIGNDPWNSYGSAREGGRISANEATDETTRPKFVFNDPETWNTTGGSFPYDLYHQWIDEESSGAPYMKKYGTNEYLTPRIRQYPTNLFIIQGPGSADTCLVEYLKNSGKVDTYFGMKDNNENKEKAFNSFSYKMKQCINQEK